MRVQDLLRPLLEDFTLFAERVDKEFLSYIDREELYKGLERAQELKERQQEPLKRAYLKWIEKTFVFLLDRDVELERKGAMEEDPWFDIVHCLGLQKVYVDEDKVEMGKAYGEVDEELEKFITSYTSKGYFWGLAGYIAMFKAMEGAFINGNIVEEFWENFSQVLLRNDGYYLWQIPIALVFRTYYKLFPEKRPAFSKILSDRLSQAIREGFPEKHIRVIQTAIAVIKEDPESLPKGEPQSFAEKWLRGELEEFMGV
jgi:hypothetical protein